MGDVYWNLVVICHELKAAFPAFESSIVFEYSGVFSIHNSGEQSIGRLHGYLAKIIRGDHEPNFYKIACCLGSLYRHLQKISEVCNFGEAQIFEANLEKLRDRAERGVIRGSGDDR